ncbi:hypothetical protein [Arenimonas terrae]|jgi:hypothetical protein|uniref:Uncharacterized protein n=1 Tax=Arenimonas terrae TaxID=2546226 RepID=A0A5C4RWV8_9GAMM|nr:hypothetical protein [Arenimonas terrae]TNJ35432.1 hypothetical protein E1B00_06660 [Arenimonas terrae]
MSLPPRIHVVIDELTLRGLSRTQAETVLCDFRKALERELSAPSLASALQRGNHTASVSGKLADGRAPGQESAPLGFRMATRISQALLK